MRRLLSLGLLLLVACGPAGTATQGSPTPSTAATGRATATPREVQFVVLEARGPHSQMGSEPGVADAHDRVAIVGLDGVARAKADFTPRTMPVVGNAAAVLQPEARIAGGRVFYADGAGILRELTRTGTRLVTTFVLKPQQEISFGVSPDGSQLEASRFTFPPLNPNSTNPGDIFLSNTYRYELLAATAGGTSRVVRSLEGGNEVTQEPEVVGWTASGPLATRGSATGTQQSTMGRTLFGHAVRLDASGNAGAVLGGPGCTLLSVSGETLLCVDDTFVNYTVRRADGTTVWALPPMPSGQYYAYVVLSPDQAQIAFTGGVRRRNGSVVTLPATFRPEGWLDNQTLIGITGDNQPEMALVRLASPTTVEDLGFKGQFIGVLP